MSILGKLFGSSNVQMSQQRAVEIIQEYGAVMEHDSPVPGCVADAGKLPYSNVDRRANMTRFRRRYVM